MRLWLSAAPASGNAQKPDRDRADCRVRAASSDSRAMVSDVSLGGRSVGSVGELVPRAEPREHHRVETTERVALLPSLGLPFHPEPLHGTCRPCFIAPAATSIYFGFGAFLVQPSPPSCSEPDQK